MGSHDSQKLEEFWETRVHQPGLSRFFFTNMTGISWYIMMIHPIRSICSFNVLMFDHHDVPPSRLVDLFLKQLFLIFSPYRCLENINMNNRFSGYFFSGVWKAKPRKTNLPFAAGLLPWSSLLAERGIWGDGESLGWAEMRPASCILQESLVMLQHTKVQK